MVSIACRCLTALKGNMSFVRKQGAATATRSREKFAGQGIDNAARLPIAERRAGLLTIKEAPDTQLGSPSSPLLPLWALRSHFPPASRTIALPSSRNTRQGSSVALTNVVEQVRTRLFRRASEGARVEDVPTRSVVRMRVWVFLLMVCTWMETLLHGPASSYIP